VDAEPLATYRGGEFDGYAVITRRKVGAGQVMVLGSIPSQADLLRLVAEAPIAKASDNVRLIRRSGKENGILALELGNQPGFVELDGEYWDLLHDRPVSGRIELQPYRILVASLAGQAR
jgi:beta-galactosidase GanA